MFEKFTIQVKLLMGFFTVAFIAAIIGIYGTLNISKLNTRDQLLNNQVAEPMGQLTYIATLIQKTRIIYRDLITENDPAKIRILADSLNRTLDEIAQRNERYRLLLFTDQGKETFAVYQNALNQVRLKINELEVLALVNKDAEANIMQKTVLHDAVANLEKEFNINVNLKLAAGKTIAEENTQLASTSSTLMVTILLLGVLIAIALGFFIARNIKQINKSLLDETRKLVEAASMGKLEYRADPAKINFEFRAIPEGFNQTLESVIGPLNVAAHYIQKISNGDMPELITSEYKGDFNTIKNNLNSLVSAFNDIIAKAKLVSKGDLTVTLKKRSENDELMQALSEMVSQLNEIVTQVMEAAQNVAISSNEMSTTATQLSQGANEQAASAEEVTSSIEEMSSAIQQNSDNAMQTEKIAVSSSQGIMEVNSSALKSLEAMRQISEKIKVINDIAEKTDILAINAAIEAARAGEHGKGFAVVAAEVRKLAEVSQKSALEINALSSSALRVTEESGAMMQKIIPEIQRTAQLVQEIAASSNEQRSGSEQITKAVVQFSQVTQQNSAAAEEMSSSSEEMASQAEMLKETIGFFNTGKLVAKATTTKGKPTIVAPKKIIKTNGLSFHLNDSVIDDKEFERF